MTQHKIQSSGGALAIELDPVPKLLGKLTREWAPKSFVVSFKLETNEQILINKAQIAIQTYHVNLVVANTLQSRADKCLLVDGVAVRNEKKSKLTLNNDILEINRPKEKLQIEPLLVQEVVIKHLMYGLEHSVRIVTPDDCSNQNNTASYKNDFLQSAPQTVLMDNVCGYPSENANLVASKVKKYVDLMYSAVEVQSKSTMGGRAAHNSDSLGTTIASKESLAETSNTCTLNREVPKTPSMLGLFDCKFYIPIIYVGTLAATFSLGLWLGHSGGSNYNNRR